MRQLSADASDQMLSGADRLSEEKADAIDALLTKALEDFTLPKKAIETQKWPREEVQGEVV